MLPYSPLLKSLDYGKWRIVQPKGRATAHPKMVGLKHLFSNSGMPKSGNVAAKLPRAQTALREVLLLLAAPIAIISQATVLAYQ